MKTIVTFSNGKNEKFNSIHFHTFLPKEDENQIEKLIVRGNNHEQECTKYEVYFNNTRGLNPFKPWPVKMIKMGKLSEVEGNKYIETTEIEAIEIHLEIYLEKKRNHLEFKSRKQLLSGR
jgi:hypothetical protein